MERRERRGLVLFLGLLVSCLFFAIKPSYSEVPVVASVVPASGTVDSHTEVTIRGENFEPGARVSLLNGGPFVAGIAEIRDRNWAYAGRVHVDGDYAYVAGRTLNIFDISDPSSPVLVGHYGNLWEMEDAYVYGGYVYALTDLSSVVVLVLRDAVSVDFSNWLDFEGYASSNVYASGNYLYIGIKSRTSGLGIFDISDPEAPSLVSFHETVDDVFALQVAGNYLYAVLEGGIGIFDITNPVEPVLISCFMDDAMNTPHITNRPLSAIRVEGGLAYVAGFAGMFVVDVSDPSDPALIGSIDLPVLEKLYTYRIDVSSNYAFVAVRDHGLYIVDVGNPEAPALVGIYGREANDVFVDEGHAFVAGGRSLQVLDITNPVIPALRGVYFSRHGAYSVYVQNTQAFLTNSYPEEYTHYFFTLESVDVADPVSPAGTDFYSQLNCNSPMGGRTTDVFVQDDYAYVAFGPFGLKVFNVSNPAVLTPAGGLDSIGAVTSVHVSGDYAYAIGTKDHIVEARRDLYVLDISSPSSPVPVASVPLPNYSSDVCVSGDFAYVAEFGDGLRIFDISDPSVPRFVASYDTPGIARGVYVTGRYAYVADDEAGLQVIDVSDPSVPRFVASYDTPGIARGVYVTGRYAYVADGVAGLQVIDVSDPSAPCLVDSILTPGVANSVYVSGDYTYVASGTTGLVILEKKGCTVKGVEVISPDTITATFPAGLPEGPYHVLVTNPGGQNEEGYLYNGFVVGPAPGKCKGRMGGGGGDERARR